MVFEKSLYNSNTMRREMNTKVIFVIFLTMLVLIPSVSSLDSLGTFKKYECVQLIQTCSNCTFVNISKVMYPDTSQAIGQTPMAKLGTFYNYSFCKTSELGTYTVNGFGDLDGSIEVWIYTFTITPSGGPENNTTFFIIFILCATGVLLLAFIFHNYIFSMISGFLFLGLGVYSMIYGFGQITNTYTQILSLIIIGFGAIITIISGLDLIEETSTGDSLYSGYGFKEEDDF